MKKGEKRATVCYSGGELHQAFDSSTLKEQKMDWPPLYD